VERQPFLTVLVQKLPNSKKKALNTYKTQNLAVRKLRGSRARHLKEAVDKIAKKLRVFIKIGVNTALL
jgi:hypothetical protein